MKFPQYWTRERDSSGNLVARGWSDTSLEEAASHARQRLQRIVAALGAGRQPDQYSYVIDNVICEEVIDRIEAGGRELAVISRNAYGSLVMNTPLMMFVDIDLPKPRRSGGLLGWLFGRPADVANPEQQAIEKIRQWQKHHDDFAFRLYRTAGGLRLIVANRHFTRVDEQVLSMLQQLDSDPLYRKLCDKQGCFRARLSPKPWRIGTGSPPSQFPFWTTQQEQDFNRWYAGYVGKAAGYSVCRFVETIGVSDIDPLLIPLVEQHDQLCCGEDNRPLA